MKPKPKEPNYPAILHFTCEDRGDLWEYVVIATEGPIKDHCAQGYTFHGALEIDDTGTLPENVRMQKI